MCLQEFSNLDTRHSISPLRHYIDTLIFNYPQNLNAYSFCPICQKIFHGWNVDQVLKQHPEHSGDPGKDFPGVLIQTDFISDVEAHTLTEDLDEMPWDISQSGRRKQNWGPKANFKKMKLGVGKFNGFPKCTEYIQERFQQFPILRGFQTIEQCSLEYTKERGASIDPHVDDCWVWGERIVTVNCLGDSVLTLSR
jgi:DNA N6-methyl adenine demethylase